jgi:hypothetical protein
VQARRDRATVTASERLAVVAVAAVAIVALIGLIYLRGGRRASLIRVKAWAIVLLALTY